MAEANHIFTIWFWRVEASQMFTSNLVGEDGGMKAFIQYSTVYGFFTSVLNSCW